jgi:hypothetical protein
LRKVALDELAEFVVSLRDADGTLVADTAHRVHPKRLIVNSPLLMAGAQAGDDLRPNETA